MPEQYLVFATLVLVLILFIWGRWRYDLVAMIALLFLTLCGLIPAEEAFYGFSHPAVITVAAVLILSRALMNAGIVDLIVRPMSGINQHLHVQLATLVAGVTVCSAFMNNIGALALFMPVAIRMARKSKITPSISVMENQTARSLNLRTIYGINLLGISREGARLKARPDQIRFRVGDVLLLQGRIEVLREVMASIGCLPLVERGLRLGQPRRVFLSIAIFAAALVSTALGLLSIQIAFIVAAVLMLLAGFISLREIYDSIDWPVIVLLGAMIPVSRALETTGGAETIGKFLYSMAGNFTPWATLTIVLVITMLLSNVVNNAAAALLMAPVAAPLIMVVWPL